MTEDLAYDLRQKYAERVGVHLEVVSRSRMAKDYPAYFQALEDLFTVVKHKFKNKKPKDEVVDPEADKKKKKEKVKKKTDIEIWEELRIEAIKKANEFPNVYLGRTDDPNEVAEVQKAFRDMEMFLFKVMDDSKMFGSSGYNEGM